MNRARLSVLQVVCESTRLWRRGCCRLPVYQHYPAAFDYTQRTIFSSSEDESDDETKQAEATKQALQQLWEHGYRLINEGRPHSSSELRRKLFQLCIRRQRYLKSRRYAHFGNVECSEVVDTTIRQLQEDKALDDTRYAIWHVEQRELHRPRSTMQLRGELFSKGVHGQIVDKVLETYDEKDAAHQLIQRSMKLRNMSPDEAKKFLENKGYSPRVVHYAMRYLRLNKGQ